MAFDWERFLSRYNVPYATKGPNVGRQHIAVQCPFCGADDPSHHLSIDLRGYGWRCFRNQNHRGRSRSRLIQALLKCSPGRAQELAGEQTTPLPTDEDFGAEIAARLGIARTVKRTRLTLPEEFQRLDSASRLADAFWEYLYARGYDDDAIEWLTDNYDLMFATRGAYAYRIIIPITDQYGRLQTWTGRTIQPDRIPRYKTLSMTPGKNPDEPLALAPPTKLLLGLRLLVNQMDAKALVVCEGPFDALRISAYGHRLGVFGTCLFGQQVSDAQAFLLAYIQSWFPRISICMDSDAALRMLPIMSKLSRIRCDQIGLPEGVKDPGDLGHRQAKEFVRSLVA